MSKQTQIIGIAIVSMLILIFGALLGIFFSISQDSKYILDEEYFEEELGPDLFGDHFSYDRFTYSQFSKLTNIHISNREDLINFLQSEGYYVEFDDDILEAEKELDCTFNDFYEQEVCEYHMISSFDDEIEFFRELEFLEEEDE